MVKKFALLSGASGLIGTALRKQLAAEGWQCRQLVRRNVQTPYEVEWHAGQNSAEPDLEKLGEPEIAIHLSGTGIADKRWSEARKRLIAESRIGSTRTLVTMLSKLENKPRLLICASAIGIYGERGDEFLDEDSTPGTGFLPELCRKWEAAAAEAAQAGIHVISARFGVVLDKDGGALARMLPLFRLGLGGPLGSGRQWMSWISAQDTARALAFLANQETPMVQAVNVVTPNPITNAEFTRTLGRVLHRPALLPVPAFALRLAFGEMMDATLLASTRTLPKRLEAMGFQFNHPTLEDALRSASL